MKLYTIDLWKENSTRYGIALDHMHSVYWTMDKLKEMCCNADVIKNLKGINTITVIKQLDGTCWVNQVSGYTMKTGLYGYLVKLDNSLERFC